jgi:hypothetical protein
MFINNYYMQLVDGLDELTEEAPKKRDLLRIGNNLGNITAQVIILRVRH